MKPISKVQTKGLPARMLKALAESQNEMAERINYLVDAVASLSAKPKAKSKAKGDKK